MGSGPAQGQPLVRFGESAGHAHLAQEGIPATVLANLLGGPLQTAYLVFNFLIGDTPKAERPIYVAVFSALTGIAGFVGPVIGGWLFKLAAESAGWLSRYGIMTGCGAVLFALSLAVAPPTFRAAAQSPPVHPPTAL